MLTTLILYIFQNLLMKQLQQVLKLNVIPSPPFMVDPRKILLMLCSLYFSYLKII